MIPSDVRLYSWIDIQDVLFRAKKSSENKWPTELFSVRAYWSGLYLEIKNDSTPIIIKWLSLLFENRYDTSTNSIIFFDEETKLNVIFEEVESINYPTNRPLMKVPNIIYKEVKEPELKKFNSAMPFFAFHSFKGGVGRTLHAIALANAIAAKNKKVLIIDGDLEAPGITFLIENYLNCDISYFDLLALLYSDVNKDGKNSISFVANKLKSQFRNNIYFLPAFRSRTQFNNDFLLPGDLIENFENGYILSDSIYSIAEKLKVDAIIIDLRAGLTEISSGLILDPRTKRVLVTSFSSQSLIGTQSLLEILAEKTPGNSNKISHPKVIITQIPDNELDSKLFLNHQKDLLKQSYFDNITSEENELFIDSLDIIESRFLSELISLPEKWEMVCSRIKNTNIERLCYGLYDVEDKSEYNLQDIDAIRKKLYQITTSMIYAETGKVDHILWTRPLKNLIIDHSNKIPNAVVIGAKGSGKTLLFLEIMKCKTWAEFCRKGKVDSDIFASILPVLKPANLQSTAQDLLNNRLNNIKKEFSFKNFSDSAIDYIEKKLKIEFLSESEWRDIWLNSIAISAGYKYTDIEVAGKEFLCFLRKKGKKIVAVFDGIEDLFQTKESTENNSVALRGLFQKLPDWLGQQPEQPLGVIIMVRQDYIDSAIQQNVGQFIDKYNPYLLRWDALEALKLVAYICSDIEILNPSKSIEEIDDKNEIINLLNILWGKKLGHDESKEAYSANWVLTCLSDWKGQIQARDIVRFLNTSSKLSISDKATSKKERILTVPSIKTSVEKCSEEKVLEVGKENKTLDGIFKKIKSIKKNKDTPFPSGTYGITPGEIKILIDNGVLYQDTNVSPLEYTYHVAEIYRHGLKFKYKGRKMTKMLAYRRAIES